MTGYIKPKEIFEAQKEMVAMMDRLDMDPNDLQEGAREFLKLHPVTQEKEQGTFRKVNGVYVTDDDFKQAEKLQRPVDGLF